MEDKIKVHFVRKVYGLGGGTISGNIFEKLLSNYVELCELDEAQVVHNYDGPLEKFKKPSVFVVNSWKFTCPACIQTTTYDEEICLKCSLFKCMNCYAHNKTFKTKTKKEAMRLASSLYYFKNKQRLSQLKQQENIVSISKSLGRVLEENGVNVTQAIYDPIDPFLLEKEKQTTNEKYFFHHGNYDWIHGVSLLIDSRKYTKHPLKMVGWGVYTDEVNKTDINSLGAVHDFVKIKELINNSYAYIYPCLHNNFGRSLIEAMTLGKPIIAINRGFSKEIIENGKSGILINPNPKELADAMQYLWDNEKEAKRMGENARKIALKEFHPDVIFGKYIKLYKSLI
jgi:glycosyltransferase involved in cell wall biosynthesis